MSERTICGGCNCRVSVKLQHPDDHNCVLIADLKKNFNLALSEIQNDYELRIKNLANEITRVSSAMTASGLISHDGRIKKLEKELSTCIDVKLLYSDRQARDTWQQGCEVMIADLCKRVADMDYMLKQSLGCVDNSHADENAKRFGLAPVSHLNKIAKEQLKGTNPKEIIFNEVCFFPPDVFDKIIPKIHHPSRKHLEGKLREKNQLIKQMDETTDYLNEQLDKKDDRIRDLEKQLAARNAECQKKDQHIDQLIKGRDLMLEKINHLRSIRSMGEKCDRPCCRPAPASYL